MLSIIKRHKLGLFFMLYIGYTMVSNFVHPVTPAFLQLINCSNSMFGFAFAAMALGQFVTSALWGKVGDKIGYARSLVFGFLGYGISALIFSMAKSWHLVVLGRFIGGLALGSMQVNSMAYLTSMDASREDKSRLLVVYASIASIGGAFGFLIGGLIGDINIYYSFYAQRLSLFLFALITLFFVKEHPTFKKSETRLTARDVNPFTSIIRSAKLINANIGVFLASAFITIFASIGFDQNFNYYLRAKFNFAPSSSGMFKAAVGIISLVVNFTISMWIVKKVNISKALSVMLVVGGVAIFAMVMANNTTMVLILALLYYASYAIFIPLQQSVMLKNDDASSMGSVAGLLNTARSLGMMLGPTFAGLMFDINPDYAFLTFAASLVLASIITFINYRQLKNKGIY